MQLDDLLVLLREDFAAQIPQAESAMRDWQAEPGHPSAPFNEIKQVWQRGGQAAEMVGLQGFGAFLTQLESFAKSCWTDRERVDPARLAWLAQWPEPALAYLDAPAQAGSTAALLAYLRSAPDSTDAAQLDALSTMLAVPPSLPADMLAAEQEVLAPAVDADVSLSLDDVDMDLFGTFLADAPAQVERLSEFGRVLAAGNIDQAGLQEAQRIAHTFKGSGNIIGLPGVGRMAHRVEDLFDYALERIVEGEQIPKPMARDALGAIECLAQMVGHLNGEDAPPGHRLAALQRLLDWVNALRDGSAEEWQPEAVQIVVQTIDADEEPAAQQAGSAQAANAGGEQLRVGTERLNRLMRRAGQSLVYADRYTQLARDAVDKLQRLEVNHQKMTDRLRELELAVERQTVTLTEKRDAGLGFDPLEMDRYDALQTGTRFLAEAAQDEMELARQARIETERMLSMLREHGVSLRDQHRELIDARLVAAKTVAPRLRRNVLQTASATQKQARLEIEGEAITLDSDVLQRLTEPLLHLLRNAVDHGIEPPQERITLGKAPEGVVRLKFERVGQEVRLTCSDDGRGLDLMAIFQKAVGFGLIDAHTNLPDEEIARLILRAGFSTRDAVTEVSGRGVGLDVVAERVRGLKGRLDIEFEPGKGTRFVLQVPVSAGSAHALIVRSEDELVALAADQVVVGLAADQGTFREVVGKPGEFEFDFNANTYPGFSLAHWLGFDAGTPAMDKLKRQSVVLARGAQGVVALSVDNILESRELVLQEVGVVLRRIPGLVAASQRIDGRPLFLLDVPALERLARLGGVQRGPNLALRKRLEVKRTLVLVADDALSVRKSMEQLLTDAGFEAMMAIDGADALERLRERTPALILTDLEMPNLNGIELTRRVREVPDWENIPMVMITSRATDKHRDLAIGSGIDLYLTKPYTDIDLLSHVKRLVQSGRPARD